MQRYVARFHILDDAAAVWGTYNLTTCCCYPEEAALAVQQCHAISSSAAVPILH